MKHLLKKHLLSVVAILFLIGISVLFLTKDDILAAAPSGGYAAGATLNPDCFPDVGDPDCKVIAAGGDFADAGEAGTADRTLGNTDAFDLGFITDGLTRLHIQSDGNVGIGVSTPGYDVTIKSDDMDYGLVHTATSIASSVIAEIGTWIDADNEEDTHFGGFIGTKTNHPFHLFANDDGDANPDGPIPRLTIEKNGNVGIGTDFDFSYGNTVEGIGVIGLSNATTVPIGAITSGGGVLYSTGGILHWLKQDGTDVDLTAGGGGGPSVVNQVKVSLSAAQIEAFDTVPVELVAAPGAGFALQVVNVAVRYNFVSEQYSFSFGEALIKNPSAIGEQAKFDESVLQALSSNLQSIQVVTGASASNNMVEGEKLQIKAIGSSATCTGTCDGTLDIYLSYRTITL
ncbi:hypothetical protein COB64_03580 [Candidatus Wolfebacteria bacterium]|nr:MAG: hypothetical protein COB64_03580 [Candidatus Wolfebacteria bacterium]